MCVYRVKSEMSQSWHAQDVLQHMKCHLRWALSRNKQYRIHHCVQEGNLPLLFLPAVAVMFGGRDAEELPLPQRQSHRDCIQIS